jgi:hypothetical protein
MFHKNTEKLEFLIGINSRVPLKIIFCAKTFYSVT